MDDDNQILECDFTFKCPKKWESLTTSDDPEKRFCESCQRDVFFITTRKELEIYKKLGHCVAANVYNPLLREGLIVAGGIAPRNSSVIHIYGDQENADEVIVALNRRQRKKRHELEEKKRKTG